MPPSARWSTRYGLSSWCGSTACTNPGTCRSPPARRSGCGSRARLPRTPGSPPQIVVRPVEPILAGRGEDVYPARVLERLGAVGQVAREHQDLARTDQHLLFVGAHQEAQPSLDHLA